ncbi:geranylgeranyl reductase [Methanosarcina sp. 2.H.T.1A.6]|uniref:geranylgeranyl reductase family protein n=1 Tax=unclassified Methanosarcina TaxID=2644672 RepID=UPI000622B087|nr:MULTISPECIES: geranylgeranyl reductase family protein [unclassified Methanosarcina]KKG14107.1 geranylgeranyl reductase [Methanosarcina sp. 2.H.T.1A.3]KKG15239.1 geranylgeranyl reductase [Methanosarcina sp. 2.H.T.1A.15]KKG19597.1 geranylgeranyl reductase [Methanosarcina sp. 2.H.T.1A.6]KKG26749.1 geranylgeranyl reductase [Methanosarcina sp. 2.H.T.1A.8]
MYDVIIVGGGPSGASAGRRAGKLGLKTLLLEKEEFPRYKPCGGGLSKHAISFLDFELSEDVIEWEVTGARVSFKGQTVEAHKDHSLCTMVSRDVFDNLLLDKAKESGAEVHTGEKVFQFMENPEFVEITTEKGTYQARFAIIAEGAHGLLKTCVRPVDSNEECGICVVTEVPASEEEIEKRSGKTVDMCFGVAGGGYGWIFPHRTYYSVGVGGLIKDLPHPKETMLEFLKDNGFTGDYKLKGHKIPLGGVKRKITGSRVLLSGDAAGFVDAFSGEGLAYAISSGQFAAEAIAGICRCDGNLKDLSRYESLCQAEFGTHLKYSLMFSRIMHRFPTQSFKIFSSSEKMVDKYLEVVDFSITYKEYLRWSVLNFKLR